MKLSDCMAIAFAFPLGTFAQGKPPGQLQLVSLDQAPVFQEAFTHRTVRAVSYEHRSGATKVDFIGTNLMPSASGHAKVDSKRGALHVGAEFAGLAKPTTFGHEYITYVLCSDLSRGQTCEPWRGLGWNNNRSELDVTTDLQTFALIVTAEPYYAVRQLSNAIVLDNVVRNTTKGTSEAVDAKLELMDRGGYIPSGYSFDAVVVRSDLPLEFFEARNALRIVHSENADEYATDSYRYALPLMDRAE
jgi:hypothetical protein